MTSPGQAPLSSIHQLANTSETGRPFTDPRTTGNHTISLLMQQLGASRSSLYNGSLPNATDVAAHNFDATGSVSHATGIASHAMGAVSHATGAASHATGAASHDTGAHNNTRNELHFAPPVGPSTATVGIGRAPRRPSSESMRLLQSVNIQRSAVWDNAQLNLAQIIKDLDHIFPKFSPPKKKHTGKENVRKN